LRIELLAQIAFDADLLDAFEIAGSGSEASRLSAWSARFSCGMLPTLNIERLARA
jgi:hypothetical protein